MSDTDTTDEALALLSVIIGTIMEDEVDSAVSSLPAAADARQARFAGLAAAGRDIAALAAAGELLIRRRG